MLKVLIILAWIFGIIATICIFTALVGYFIPKLAESKFNPDTMEFLAAINGSISALLAFTSIIIIYIQIDKLLVQLLTN